MKLMLIEDELAMRKYLVRAIMRHVKGLLVREISCEKEFSDYFKRHKEPEIDAIVLDVILQFQPAIDGLGVLDPPEVEREGYTKAGYRILKLIRSMEGYANIPVVVYSNYPAQSVQAELERRGLMSPLTVVLSKGIDHERLIENVRKLVERRQSLGDLKKFEPFVN